MSLEFTVGERYIVLESPTPFIGTFQGVSGDNLRFSDVTTFVEIDTALTHQVSAACIIDAEPYRQRVTPLDLAIASDARSVARELAGKKRVVVQRMPERDIE